MEAATAGVCEDELRWQLSGEACLYGLGGVFRDGRGLWFAGFAYFRRGGNLLLVEATALRDGLQLAWRRGYRQIIRVVDCAMLVQLLQEDMSDNFSLFSKRFPNFLVKIGKSN